MARAFSRAVVDAIDRGKYLWVRAGPPGGHKFTGIWVVVVDGRVFARSWTLKKSGWFRTFLEDPRGAIRVGERELAVRARPARGERIRDAVEAAYAAKYVTPANRKYVRGFRTRRRRETTLEFLPR